MSAEPNLKIRINLMKPGSENNPPPVPPPKPKPATTFPWRHLTTAGVVLVLGGSLFWLFGGQEQASQGSNLEVVGLNSGEKPVVDLRPEALVSASTPVAQDWLDTTRTQTTDSSRLEDTDPETRVSIDAGITEHEAVPVVADTLEPGDIAEDWTVPVAATASGNEMAEASPQSLMQAGEASSSSSADPEVTLAADHPVEEAVVQVTDDAGLMNSEPVEQPVKEAEHSTPVAETSPGAVAGRHIARTQLTSGIDALEPVDRIGPELKAAGEGARRIYFFSDLRNMSGDTVVHQWLYDDQEVARVIIPVKGDRWRAYSSKWLEPGKQGEWEVLVADSAGEVLHRQRFHYGN